MEIIQKLNTMKKKIEEAKQNKARKEGQYEELLKSLQKHGCNSVEEAQQLVKETLIEKQNKEQQLIDGIKELEKNFDWNI